MRETWHCIEMASVVVVPMVVVQMMVAVFVRRRQVELGRVIGGVGVVAAVVGSPPMQDIFFVGVVVFGVG